MAIKKGKIITVTSVKGGVGKTTFTLSLAALYEKQKKKVLVIDMDLFSGDVAAILNVDVKKDIYTLFEDITNNNFYDLDSYITKKSDYLDVLAAPKDSRYASKMSSTFLNLMFSQVSTRYDVILVDTNHFLNEINLVTFDKSDSIIYLINNTVMNLKNMRSMISIFTDMKLNRYKIVLYEAREKRRTMFSKFDIKNIIKDNIDYIVSNDFYIKDIDRLIVDNKFIAESLKIIDKKNSRIFNKIAKDLIK